MRSRFRLAAVVLGLAAGALGGIGGNAPRRDESAPPRPGQAAQPAEPAAPTANHTQGPSKVFPDGGFPSLPKAPEGGIPAPGVKREPILPHPELLPPVSDYSPAGSSPVPPQA